MGLGLAEPGFATACFVEIEDYPRTVLAAAQAAGYFHAAPIWDDLKRFSGRPWRGIVDTVLAGYPCQPFSAAGQRKGEDDPRHLWPDVARIIREVEPEWVFLENVPGHVTLGLETVLRTLWEMGWTPAVGLFAAGEVGAGHERLRVFIVAHPSGPEREGQQRGQHHAVGRQVKDGHPALPGRTGLFPPGPSDSAAWSDTLAVAPDLAPAAGLADCLAWAGRLAQTLGQQDQGAAESDLCKLAHGLSKRSSFLRLLGNAVVPLQAAYAWQSLARAHGLGPINFGGDE